MLRHMVLLGSREAPASTLFLAWRPGSSFLPPDGRLENPRRGTMRTRGCRCGRSGQRRSVPRTLAGPPLTACSPVWDLVAQPWRRWGAQEHLQGTLGRTPRWAWDWNPALGFLYLEACPPSRKSMPSWEDSTEHPSQRYQREHGPGCSSLPRRKESLLSGLQPRGGVEESTYFRAQSLPRTLRPHGL